MRQDDSRTYDGKAERVKDLVNEGGQSNGNEKVQKYEGIQCSEI